MTLAVTLAVTAVSRGFRPRRVVQNKYPPPKKKKKKNRFPPEGQHQTIIQKKREKKIRYVINYDTMYGTKILLFFSLAS